MKRFREFQEDAAANAAGNGGVAGIGQPPGSKFGEPPGPSSVLQIKRRKKPKEVDETLIDRDVATQVMEALTPSDTFAGADVFDVDRDQWVLASQRLGPRIGKDRYHRYAKYLNMDSSGEDIRSSARSHRRDVILRDQQTGAMTYLRRRNR